MKEVLSETPIAKPAVLAANDQSVMNNRKVPVIEEVMVEPSAVNRPAEEMVSVSEVSEVSEMCSFSESLSTVAEKRDDDGEVTQRVPRSPAKIPRKRAVSSGAKERGIRSPARRAELSPAKRTHIAPSKPVRAPAAASRRNVGPANALRRDPGESSTRRSRSPATRGEMGQPRPVRYKSPASTSAERSSLRRAGARAEDVGEEEKRNEEVSPETTESLENPHVSLECFIFL